MKCEPTSAKICSIDYGGWFADITTSVDRIKCGDGGWSVVDIHSYLVNQLQLATLGSLVNLLFN